ncbi:MAG: hypothetical protein KJ558_04635 [Gammaproteobacteria bacterium]|nr:hypothetical protein [Gammaproteobacteria bacterium]MBU1654107.1 hypothetical protein [Gammaproteobacteria bacterium]MBU1961676.1 hypothetical protein [Gammaproteobacteria bacterium]
MQRFIQELNRTVNNANDIRNFYDAASQVAGEIGFLALLVSLLEYIQKNSAFFERERTDFETAQGRSFEQFSSDTLKKWIIDNHVLDQLVHVKDVKSHQQLFTQLWSIGNKQGVTGIAPKLILLFRHMSQALADNYPYDSTSNLPIVLSVSDPCGNAFLIGKDQSMPFGSLNSGGAIHGFQFTDWRAGLTIIPQSLDGACIHWEHLNPTTTRRMDSFMENLRSQEGQQNPVIKLGLWPISRDLNMKPQVSPPPITCRGRGQASVYRIIPEKGLHGKVKQFGNVLEKCQDEQIAILLIPELTMSPALLDGICKKLRDRHFEAGGKGGDYPLLVVAGSFHVDEKGEEKASGAFSNTAVVLDGAGEVLWRTQKRHQFVLRGDQIPRIVPRVWSGLAKSGFNCEPRTIGSTIEIRDTPLGRTWVTICLDFLNTANRMAAGPEYLGMADWILIPAASCRTDDFESSAKRFANSSQIVSVLVNACWLIKLFSCEKIGVGMAYAPQGLGKIVWGEPCAIGSAVCGNPPPAKGGTCTGGCDQCLLVLSVPCS